RTVGEQRAPRLTAGTVVGLVLGMDDPLHGRAAHRARQTVPAVHGHRRTERGDALRESLAHLVPQTLRPLTERRASRVVQAGGLLRVLLSSGALRGEARPVRGRGPLCAA